MIGIEGQPILAAARMKAAELASGVDLYTLMERAGAGVAEAVRRLAAGAEALILCGPGNNGGDGYVAARVLREAGHPVRVAALGEPKTELAQRARQGWTGPVEPLLDLRAEWNGFANVVVDCVFGTGLSRPLDAAMADQLASLMFFARLSIAVDLPSGVDADTGALLAPADSSPQANVTLALGALKPAHVLMPAADRCGHVRLLDMGVAPESDWRVVDLPALAAPGPDSHKYTRGMVAVVAGPMAGAGALAAMAAARAGAGYVLLLGSATDRLPHAVVRRRWSEQALAEPRIGAVVIGPGLGRDVAAADRLAVALRSGKPLVLDADALWLLAELGQNASRPGPVVTTPHGGEFARAYGGSGGKIEATLAAARRTGHVIVHKGSDTVITAPDGRVGVHPDGPAWLSTAGTGDVLAGTVGALLAGGLAAFDAAQAAVWLHADAARRCGASFIADDLAHALTAARASL